MGESEAAVPAAPCCLLHSFFAIATAYPSRVAVIHAPHRPDQRLSDRRVQGPLSVPVYEGDVVYTFQELHSAVLWLAALLEGKLRGDKPDVKDLSSFLSNPEAQRFSKKSESVEYIEPKTVGIIMNRSAEYLVTVLALLKVSTAFVPVDPSWPSRRIFAALADSKPSLVITNVVCTNFNQHESPIVGEWPVLSLPEEFIKASTLENQFCDMQRFVHSQKARSFCYIMYTSGSSGKPRGVCGTEKGLLNRLMWMETAYPYATDDIGCFKTSIAFIDHLTESLGPLIAGIPLVIPCHMVLRSNPLALVQFLKAYGVTRLTAVPSLLYMLLPALEAVESRLAIKLRILVSSGEALSLTLWRSLQLTMPQTTILNLYGSTELSGDCTYYDCNELYAGKSDLKTSWSDSLRGDVAIGKPISGCFFSICTESGSLAAIEEEGELWVGGTALAYGYLNDVEANNEKFINMTPTQKDLVCEERSNGTKYQARDGFGCRIFRTGDIVRQRADGNIVLVGRKDRLIKIHGHRIELREIEATLEQHAQVENAAVLQFSLSNGDIYLVAYIVPTTSYEALPLNDTCKELMIKPSNNFLKSVLNEWLKQRLPSYMMPYYYIFLKNLPLTTSGKVDYSSLPKPFVDESYNLHLHSEALTENQELERIMQLYAQVLKVDHISVSDNFFKLGGTSISAAHVAYVLKINMNLIYEHPTPSGLLSALQLLNVRELSRIGHSERFLRERIEMEPILEAGKEGKEDSHNKMLKRKWSTTYPFYEPVTEMVQGTWPFGLKLARQIAIVRCNRVICTKRSSGSPSVKGLCHQLSTNGKAWSLQLKWQCSLDACVDASPLLVVLEECWRLYIGSHAHKFLCVDAISGEIQWVTQLGGRIESTATVTHDFSQVVVGCFDGIIYFLDINTGRKIWSFQTGGEVKCQPTLDTGQGLIWCGSHDHNLYALNSTTQTCTWHHHCEGSIYASPTVDAVRHAVYVATTSGHVLAVSSKPSFHIKWMYSCGAPIFGSPALDPSTSQVFCTMVDGSVISFMPSGSIAWKVKIGGPIFAGACVSSVLPAQVLVCSRDGYLYCVDMVHGHCVWKISLSEPITAAAWVDEETEVTGNGESTYRLVCVCTTSGSLHVLKVCAVLPYKNDGKHTKHDLTTRVPSSNADPEILENDSKEPQLLLETESCCVILLTRKLAGDIFSVPLMIGGRIFVGCRDNNLYCFDLLMQTYSLS
ncbi:hypothetical protein O6H91_21G056800 [Diphasiastrum complanatum]|uniref:Uncharacterized protein n=1 Tax=Diphasiastrum complanatum TaxID=34168 RepID=A0ACC2AKR9_DIPCM|nr:hypothetical protein O6H91_21G056800 [Diphasiastrum complanatum]